MLNFIKDFYYGNIEPQEYSPELLNELKSKLNRLSQAEEQLNEKLPENEKSMFQKYVSIYNDFCSASTTDSIISGFRLGAKFTYDVFIESMKG